MNRKDPLKVGIVHPQLTEREGSESRALYIIVEALKEHYNLTLITTYASILTKFNEFYGTNISYKEVNVFKDPFSIILRRIKSFDAILGAIFSPFCWNKTDSLAR